MKQLLFILTVFPMIVSAQDSTLPRIVKDTLFTTCGYKIVEGSDIKLGVGSLPNGDFKYIAISAGSWANLMDQSMSKSGIGRRYNGHLLRVKRFRKDGNKKHGYVYNLIVGGGNIANYDCDIESAIASGEVVVPDEYKAKPAQTTIVQQSGSSPADELKKLKELLDAGAITQGEYDSTKKKILAKM